MHVRSYEPNTLRLITPTESVLFGFCLRVFHQAEPPHRVDCSAPMNNKRKRVFLKDTTTQCQFGNRAGSHEKDALSTELPPLKFATIQIYIVCLLVLFCTLCAIKFLAQSTSSKCDLYSCCSKCVNLLKIDLTS